MVYIISRILKIFVRNPYILFNIDILVMSKAPKQTKKKELSIDELLVLVASILFAGVFIPIIQVSLVLGSDPTLALIGGLVIILVLLGIIFMIMKTLFYR